MPFSVAVFEEATWVSSSLSIAGVLSVISFVCCLPSIRITGPLQLILCSCIADLGICTSFLLSAIRDNDTRCIIQGVAIQFCCTLSVLYTACLAHLLHQITVKCEVDFPHFMKWYHAGALSLATINAAVAHKYIGPTGAWCWITDEYQMMRLTFYAPLVVVFTASSLILLYSWWCIRTERLEGSAVNKTVSSSGRKINVSLSSGVYRKRKMVLWQGALILLAFLFVWLPAFANRLYDYLHPQSRSNILQFLQAAIVPLQGLLDAIILACSHQSRVAVQKYRDRHGSIGQERTGLLNSRRPGRPALVSPASINAAGLSPGSPRALLFSAPTLSPTKKSPHSKSPTFYGSSAGSRGNSYERREVDEHGRPTRSTSVGVGPLIRPPQ